MTTQNGEGLTGRLILWSYNKLDIRWRSFPCTRVDYSLIETLLAACIFHISSWCSDRRNTQLIPLDSYALNVLCAQRF